MVFIINGPLHTFMSFYIIYYVHEHSQNIYFILIVDKNVFASCIYIYIYKEVHYYKYV